jgi:hypothetical protein
MSLFFSGAIKAKELIHATFRQFPLFLIGTLFILGLIETNIAYLFLVIGSFICIAATWSLQAILSLIISKTPSISNFFMSSNASMQGCSILGVSGRAAAIAGGSSIVVPSYFIGFISFFFTYVFINAFALYQREPVVSENSKDIKEKVDNRKYQAGMAMFLCVVIFLLFLAIRLLRFGGCELPINKLAGFILILLNIAGASGLATGWYKMLQTCGGDALSDLFGIIGRLVPTNAKDVNPVACVMKA